MWKPSGFATWHLFKLDFYLPQRLGDAVLSSAVNCADSLECSQAITLKEFRIILGMRPWALRNYVSILYKTIGQVEAWLERELGGVWLECGQGENLCQGQYLLKKKPQTIKGNNYYSSYALDNLVVKIIPWTSTMNYFLFYELTQSAFQMGITVPCALGFSGLEGWSDPLW